MYAPILSADNNTARAVSIGFEATLCSFDTYTIEFVFRLHSKLCCNTPTLHYQPDLFDWINLQFVWLPAVDKCVCVWAEMIESSMKNLLITPT